MRKEYHGYARADSMHNVRVFVIEDDGFDVRDNSLLNLRLDIYNHSPTGFSWGYNGSGPHQLALAILADATEDEGIARLYYDKFVRDFVGMWPKDEDFSITDTEVKSWLKLVHEYEASE